MYETMVYWETAHTVRDQPQFVLDFARQWQAAEKVVYSSVNSIPTRCDGSRPTLSTTSPLKVLNSPRKR